MKNEFQRKLGKSNGINFIICPVAFFLLSVLLIWAALSPIIMPLLDVINVVTLSEPPRFDQSTVSPTSNFNDAPDSGILDWTKVKFPVEGEQFGQMIIESAGIDAEVYCGDGATQLRKGIGTSSAAYLPGEGHSVLLSGHNSTYLYTLGKAKKGDLIQLNTSYGKYVYQITGSKIAVDTDVSAYDLTREADNLIIYTCYPFDRLGFTADRYFVYADYLSGPTINVPY